VNGAPERFDAQGKEAGMLESAAGQLSGHVTVSVPVRLRLEMPRA
jgi:hypothetical protein